jgi:hypothetical protein
MQASVTMMNRKALENDKQRPEHGRYAMDMKLPLDGIQFSEIASPECR